MTPNLLRDARPPPEPGSETGIRSTVPGTRQRSAPSSSRLNMNINLNLRAQSGSTVERSRGRCRISSTRIICLDRSTLPSSRLTESTGKFDWISRGRGRIPATEPWESKSFQWHTKEISLEKSSWRIPTTSLEASPGVTCLVGIGVDFCRCRWSDFAVLLRGGSDAVDVWKFLCCGCQVLMKQISVKLKIGFNEWKSLND